jgi:hypothetical protein
MLRASVKYKSVGFLPAAFLALSLLGGVVQAQKEMVKEIPYRGHLDLNGEPQTGDFDFVFGLYTSPTEGTCGPPETEECVWNNWFFGVQVFNGAFSVVLGSGIPLPDDVWQNDVLYLDIGVKVAGASTLTQLSGRQKILAVPYATRSETAKNYTVRGSLVVEGTTTLAATNINGATNISGGDLTIESTSSINVLGNLSVDDQKPFKFKRYNDITGNNMYDTGVSNVEWYAVIAGFNAKDGDIYEGGEPDSIIRCLLIECPPISGNPDNWCIWPELTSQNNHEEWDVIVLFIRRKLVEEMP